MLRHIHTNRWASWAAVAAKDYNSPKFPLTVSVPLFMSENLIYDLADNISRKVCERDC